jgi:glutamate dehydrogenase
VPDDAHFARDLLAYFPDKMEKKYAEDIASHRLRREIITRVLSNDVINRGGPAFITKLRRPPAAVRARWCARSPWCATASTWPTCSPASMRWTTR